MVYLVDRGCGGFAIRCWNGLFLFDGRISVGFRAGSVLPQYAPSKRNHLLFLDLPASGLSYRFLCPE